MLDHPDAMPDGTRRPAFADALRSAIAGSGLTLDEVRRRLSERGVTLSAGSLSHWQTGRSTPRPAASPETLPALEEVLGVPEGGLRRLLPDPRPRGRGTTVHEPVDDVADRLPHWPHVRSAAGILGLPVDDRLRQVTVHEMIEVGPDRLITSHVIRVVVRAAVDRADRLVAYYCDDTPHHDLPRILARLGCRVGGRTHHPHAGLTVVELVLPTRLLAGERHLLEYEVRHVPDVVTTCEIRSLHALREAVVSVRFADGQRPVRVFRRTWNGGSFDDTAATVGDDGVVSAVRHHVAPGMLGLRWEWPDDPPRS